MTAVIEEREPGVYVRSEAVDKPVKSEKELDFFWEAPSRRVYDSQKNRIGIFAGGFVSGVFLTLIVTTGVTLLSKSMTATPGTEVAAPVNVSSVEDLVQNEVTEAQQQATTVQKTSTAVSEAAEAAKAESAGPAITTEVRPSEAPKVTKATSSITDAVTAAKTAATPKTTVKTTTPKATTTVSTTGSKQHVIQSGDTLGGLANKYYGSSDPALIDKIQKANNIKNPNGLQLNQKIIIPPKG
jgi:nucleoid-associated protein YgaU